MLIVLSHEKLTVALAVLVGLCGVFGGLFLTGVFVRSCVLFSLSFVNVVYVLLLLILLTVLVAARFAKREKWVAKVKYVLLFNAFTISVSIFYVVFSNFVNACYPGNLLLKMCSLFLLGGKAILMITSIIVISNVLLHLAIICFLPRSITLKVQPRLSFCCLIAWIVIVLTVLSAIFSAATDFIVRPRYSHMVRLLENSSLICCRDSIDCLWVFVKSFSANFTLTYRKPCPKPRQLLIILPPLIGNRDFVAKLVVVSRTGACLDFALGATKLIEDFYGCKVRVVEFIGWDHVVPEVEVNGIWYVIDVTYTTKDYPVKASEYADYLRRNYPSIYSNLERLVDFDTGQDLSKEHGLYS